MNGYAQHPQPGPSRPSPYSSPPQAPAVYPGYQQPAGYAPYPSPLPNGSPYRHVEAVPAPQPKVAYEPPVFRTFQDRKRAKDAALRAQAGALDTPAASEAAASLSYTVARPPVQLPRTTSIPDRSTLAMMGRPTDGRPPAPPIRNTRSPTIDNPLVSTSASTQNALPSPALRAHPLPHPTSRPLPSPAPSLTGSSSSHTSPSLPISPTSSQAASIYSVDRPIERSDTLASVKSVDRVGFSVSRRPLPQTPVGVNSSKSLDRGMAAGYSGMGDGFRRDMKIRQPSAVSEDSNEGSLVESLTGLGLRANSPTISSTTLPLIDPVDPQSMPPSKDASGQSAVVVPIIAFPDHDDDGPPSISFHTPADEPEPPGFTFSGPPTISVSSEDVDDPGPLSITVPAIQLPDDGETSSPLASPALTPQDGSALLCAGCDHPIIGRIVNAMKKRFHPACFKCDECGELLEHVSSYEWEGKAFCHLDYHDKFAHQCYQCKTPIVDSRFITLSDPMLGQRFYHELHFFCSECGDPFLDPSASSAPGTEQDRLSGGEEEETSAFVIHKGHPYCERCHLRLHKPKCRGCSKPIPDVAVTALDAKWHQACFVCSNCESPFANDLFFPVEGLALCISCYEAIL